MRGRNLNPERRENDTYEHTTIFDDQFIAELTPRKRNDRRRQRQHRNQPKIRTPKPQPEQNTHLRGRVTLGSRPLTQPIPLVIPQQEPFNPLASTTVPLGYDTLRTSLSWEAPRENSGSDFPGPAPPVSNYNAYHQQQHYQQDHYEVQHARPHPSQMIPSGIGANPWYTEPLAPTILSNALPVTSPDNLGQQDHTTPGHQLQPAVSLNPPRLDFLVTGPTRRSEPCHVTLDLQLSISVISAELAKRLECELILGNPSWTNWTVQTPIGLLNPKKWVMDISIESQWRRLRIPMKTASFVVVNECWTGTEIILGKPILLKLLQTDAVL
ncbi:hypothetical protein QQZ08_009577 [Neonectria magnoliae]|uniref:Uncharacterized protein n=1 Tax=Neonectria magnoliae TaxID=2732573 RepID=A0ABR1HM56_9HYPO